MGKKTAFVLFSYADDAQNAYCEFQKWVCDPLSEKRANETVLEASVNPFCGQHLPLTAFCGQTCYPSELITNYLPDKTHIHSHIVKVEKRLRNLEQEAENKKKYFLKN